MVLNHVVINQEILILGIFLSRICWRERESFGIQVFRLGPGSEPYVGNINTRFAQAKIINLTMMCNKIPSG